MLPWQGGNHVFSSGIVKISELHDIHAFILIEMQR